MKKISIGVKTFIALGLGILVGLLFINIGGESNRAVSYSLQACSLVGNIFLRLLRMLAVPLVFACITNAIASLGDLKDLRKLGLKTFSYFFVTGAISVIFGILICNLLRPGDSFVLDEFANTAYEAKSVSFLDSLVELVPTNIVSSMATDSMMQVIIFCLFLGIAILMLGEKAKTLAGFIRDLEQAMFKIVDFVMAVVPYGVFGLMVYTVTIYGPKAAGGLLGFIACDWIAALMTIFIMDFLMLVFIARVNPITFMRIFSEAIMICMATCVSVAALPLGMKTCIEKIGVPETTTNFVLPIGSTANMTGTAAFFGIIVVFTCQLVGIELTMAQYVILVFQSVMMAIGCATVPSIALVLSSTLLLGFGLPLTAIGIIIGVYRLLDIAHTPTNSIGNWVTATCIAAVDGTLGRDICAANLFNKKK